MRNTYKYTKMYSGSDPLFIEGDIFKITIPLKEVATTTVGPGGIIPDNIPHDVPHDIVGEEICRMIRENRNITRRELGKRLGISTRTVGRKLKDMGNVHYVGSGNNGHWEINENA